MRVSALCQSFEKWQFALFALVFLLPHGIGFISPFGLPNIDLPRLAVLGFHVFALLALGLNPPQGLFSGEVGRVRAALLFIGSWQLLSALSSAAVGGSVIWAIGNWLSIWGLAFLAISQRSFGEKRDQWTKLFFFIGMVLVLWGLGEYLLQQRFVTVRNTWSAEMLDHSVRLRRLYLLAIGPFPNNHHLGIALCAFSGFLLRGSSQKVVVGVGLSCAMLATGFVAGWLAYVLVLLLNLVFSAGRRTIGTWLPLAVFLGGLILIWRLGIPNGDIGSTDWAFLANDSADNRGSFDSRWRGLVSAIDQLLLHPMMGFGPGSIADVKRVPTTLVLSTDLGSVFAFFLESGLPVGLLVIALVLRAIVVGLGSRDEQAISAALGLTGIVVTGLSSPTSYFWGLAFVMCALIFAQRAGARAIRPLSAVKRDEC